MSGIPYNEYKVVYMPEFEDWLSKLPIRQRDIVTHRFHKITLGHFGDHKDSKELLN